ncbi:MAG: L,D-transpeptidase [Solirubrobacteraceae bacterium]|nr:L,D-transpeptidase [Solirubrobacteraceae bacterium]
MAVGRHRATRPRRSPLHAPVTLASISSVVTLVVVLTAVGALSPGGAEPAYADPQQPPAPAVTTPRPAPAPAPATNPVRVAGPATVQPSPVSGTALPARSGTGRRVVFDRARQRVWLVGVGPGGRDRVRRTYLVSGSLTDNLDAGRYAVWSRSRHAIGIDDSGTMEYMVRFARGERAAIGFHDIPVHRGQRVQTRAHLGTPLSHGCVRQAPADARALWRFAPVGTPVVVTG